MLRSMLIDRNSLRTCRKLALIHITGKMAVNHQLNDGYLAIGNSHDGDFSNTGTVATDYWHRIPTSNYLLASYIL